MRKIFFAAVATLAVIATTVSMLSSHDAEAQERVAPPGEGVICIWAIYTAAKEIGTRCHPGEDVEFQAEISRGVDLLDAYVVANSAPTPTAADIASFKETQGQVGRPREYLCTGDSEGLYRHLAEQGPDMIRRSVDAVTSTPGQPTWGTCL